VIEILGEIWISFDLPLRAQSAFFNIVLGAEVLV